MDAYQVKKTKKRVELFMEGPPPISGDVFLSTFSPHHQGPERVAEMLADEELYFPFQEKDRNFLIIRKAAVFKVVVDADYELEILRSYGDESMLEKDVHIVMTDGQNERGRLLIEPREAASRVSDELNRNRNFLKLKVAKSIHLVGVDHIASVRELNAPPKKKKRT